MGLRVVWYNQTLSTTPRETMLVVRMRSESRLGVGVGDETAIRIKDLHATIAPKDAMTSSVKLNTAYTAALPKDERISRLGIPWPPVAIIDLSKSSRISSSLVSCFSIS